MNDASEGCGPDGCDREKWRWTKIGARVSIGTNATVMPVSICDDVVIGAGSIVTRDISDSSFYVGNPVPFLRPLDR